MGDWIEDQLIQAENWVYAGHDIPEDHSHWSILGMGDFPPLSEIIHDVRYIYDIAAGHYPDPDALRAMSHVLNDCHEKITRLCQEYEQSLTSLSQNWTGHQSLAYYSPPTFNADEISASSPAEMLLLNMQTFTDAFQHNAQALDLFAQKFDEIRLIQAGLLICAGAAVGSIIALIAFPPDAEITVPTLTISVGGGVTSAGTILTLTPMLTLVIGTTAVSVEAVAGTVLILSLIGIALLAIPALQLASSIAVPYPSDWTLPDGSTLPKAFEDLAKKIWDQFKALLGAALTVAIVSYLACHYGWKEIEELLSNWSTFANLLTQLNNPADIADFNEAEGILHAIMTYIGPGNVAAINFPYTWRDASGGIEVDPNSHQPIVGDIDIVTNDVPPHYIEIGTYNKGNGQSARRRYRNQLVHLQREAQANGAVAMSYIQMPAVPLSANEVDALRDVIRIAREVLDGVPNWKPSIDPATGTITPPLPPDSHIVIMPPLGC